MWPCVRTFTFALSLEYSNESCKFKHFSLNRQEKWLSILPKQTCPTYVRIRVFFYNSVPICGGQPHLSRNPCQNTNHKQTFPTNKMSWFWSIHYHCHAPVIYIMEPTLTPTLWHLLFIMAINFSLHSFFFQSH